MVIDPFAFGGTPEEQERRAARARALLTSNVAVAKEADSSPHDREERADPDAGAVEDPPGSDSNGDVELQSLGREGEFDALGRDSEQHGASLRGKLHSLAREEEFDTFGGAPEQAPADRKSDGHSPRRRAGRTLDDYLREDSEKAIRLDRHYDWGIADEDGPARLVRLSRALPRKKWHRVALLLGGFALIIIGGAAVAVRSRRRPNTAPISETSEHEITESEDPSGMQHSDHREPFSNGTIVGKKSSKAKKLIDVDGLVVLPKQLEPGDSIKVSGTGGAATLNLWNDDKSEIILEFNPRGGENVIVRNSRNQNAWQNEEISGGYPFTQTDGDGTWNFELVVKNSTTIGMVVEGKKFGTFDLRRQHKISDVAKLTIHPNHPKQDKPTKDFKIFFTPAKANDASADGHDQSFLSDSAHEDNNPKNHGKSEEKTAKDVTPGTLRALATP